MVQINARKTDSSSGIQIILHLMELEKSLWCLHETVTELRPCPEQFRPHPHAKTIRIMSMSFSVISSPSFFKIGF